MKKAVDADENVMRYDTGNVDEKFYYRNEIDFPVVAEMDHAMLLVVSRILSWKQEGNSLLFLTEGDFYQKRYFYRFLDFRATYDLLDRRRSIAVKLSFLTDDILRIQAVQGCGVFDRTSEMLMPEPYGAAPKLTLKQSNKAVLVETKTLRVTVAYDPWNITIQDKNGKALFSQYTSSRTNEHAVMKYEQCPFGFLFDTEKNISYAAEQIEIQGNEHFYGFGEKFMALDKKGQNIDLWNTNCLGCNTNRTYKNVPFFMSTRGYGLFLHTSCAANANMGQHFSKAYGLLADDDTVDYFFIHGPSFKQILSRYTDLTGRAPLPPKWSFGFWISKISYRTQAEVEALAKRFRKEQIPCDVIHIDTDWYEYPWICDYKFSAKRFPRPEEMIKQLKAQGFRTTLWQMPYIESDREHPNTVWLEGFRKGYFAIRPDGREDFPHGLIDFSNPAAVEWYQNKLIRPLLEMGVAAIKVDFGESIPDFYHYAGTEGKRMHNLYPLLYNKAVFDITTAVHGKDQGIIWARSTWAGSQRYPLHWAGDPDVDFHALSATVRAGLSFGLSAFPFWSHDVGGFNAPAIPAVYARWMQVGCFSSHVRSHGFKTREPWDFGPEVTAIAKKYLRLRYRLLPYIYSQAYTCTQTSLPMFRALILEYQDDENLYHIDDEYLFGDTFLVAPVMDDSNQRRVYLPKGVWTDYWTQEIISGGQWISVEAPLDTLPLFVRENGIIPMGPPLNYVDEKPVDFLDVDLYPVVPGNARFVYKQEGGLGEIALSVGRKTVQAVLSGIVTECKVRLRNVRGMEAVVNGRAVKGVREGNVLIVKTPKAPLVTVEAACQLPTG
jgi:alpha-D-xyloside xylohydrolase